MDSEYSLPASTRKNLRKSIGDRSCDHGADALAESQGFADVGDNARACLDRTGEYAGFIKLGLARLKKLAARLAARCYYTPQTNTSSSAMVSGFTRAWRARLQG